MPSVTSQEMDELEKTVIIVRKLWRRDLTTFELSNLSVLAISSRELVCASCKLTVLCRP